MSANYKKLGDYIQSVDVRNSDLKVSHLLGLSIEKCFIESIANTIGTDFRPYKIVKRGQFAYGPVSSRNGDKITIALLKEKLEERKSGGVFLTTIQKFCEDIKLLSERSNIICISDEAHRSQNNLEEKTVITDNGVEHKYGIDSI